MLSNLRVPQARVLPGALLLALLLLALPAAATAQSQPYTVGPVILVSGPSPFAPGCGGPQPGTNYLNAEVEPYVAVNPTNGSNFVGGWQQDRWSNGGANSLRAGVTFDGGATWTPVTIPSITLCAGGPEYQRATDPWVTFSPNGTAYFFSYALNATSPANAMLVSRSTDGGLNWDAPTTLIRDDNATLFNDKNAITADPTDSNYVYAVWDRLESPQAQASATAAENALAYRGPTLLARTTDGGATWEPARIIFDPGRNNQTIGNEVVVLADGTLINGMDLIYNFKNAKKNRGLNVALIRSTDKGATWSGPIIVDKLLTNGITDPDTGAPVRTGDIIPQFAADPNSGALYAVWQDARFGPAGDAIAFARSTDGGLTWSTPIRISQNANTQAFTAAIAVAAGGTIGVTYYDFRSNTPDPFSLPTDLWFVSSRDGGATWRETHVSGPFDHAVAPVARGYFLGDYSGLAAVGRDFVAFFAAANTGNTDNRTDIFSARLTAP